MVWYERNMLSQTRVNSSLHYPNGYSAYCDKDSIGHKQAWTRHKKIISYALFNEQQNPGGQEAESPTEDSFSWYFEGALQNIKGAKLYYPDWIVRIYVFGLHKRFEALLLEGSNNVELVRCSNTSPLAASSSRKMIARFLSYDDPETLYLISRDVDSRFSPRELFAVNEWISSGAPFHVMRDHKEHGVPILGGMFGMRRGALAGKATSMTDLVSSAFAQEPNGITSMRGEDQSFLAKHIWPLVSSETVTHDVSEKRCREYSTHICLDYPMGEADGKHHIFVGQDFKPHGHSPGVHVLQYKCNFTCTV
jgi:hypothetical protein